MGAPYIYIYIYIYDISRLRVKYCLQVRSIPEIFERELRPDSQADSLCRHKQPHY